MAEANGSAAGCLDTEAFAAFGPLLEACQDYADLSGSRFLRGALAEPGDAVPRDGDPAKPLLVARLKAEPAIREFAQRLRAGDEGLRDCLERAYRLLMAESVRSGIVATCREVGLWPPQPPPAGVDLDDCTYEDTTAPLPVIAQRAFNDEARRAREEGLQALVRRAATASFIVDFAGEAGASVPVLSDAHQAMLQEFMAQVEEWAARPHAAEAANDDGLSTLSRAAASTRRVPMRTREALLAGLGLGLAAEAARRQVHERWLKNWDTPVGTALNLATMGLAVVAGVAVLRRAARPR